MGKRAWADFRNMRCCLLVWLPVWPPAISTEWGRGLFVLPTNPIWLAVLHCAVLLEA